MTLNKTLDSAGTSNTETLRNIEAFIGAIGIQQADPTDLTSQNGENFQGSSQLEQLEPKQEKYQTEDYTKNYRDDYKSLNNWKSNGSCLDAEDADIDLRVELFFSTSETSIQKAKQICARCEVRKECLNYALTNNEQYGVWGGLDEQQRQSIIHSKNRPTNAHTSNTSRTNESNRIRKYESEYFVPISASAPTSTPVRAHVTPDGFRTPDGSKAKNQLTAV